MRHYNMCATSRVIIYQKGHQKFVDARIATNQVMELENFQTNFIEANYHRTMNAIVNQEGIAVDTLSCVVNQGRLVKIQILQNCRIQP